MNKKLINILAYIFVILSCLGIWYYELNKSKEIVYVTSDYEEQDCDVIISIKEDVWSIPFHRKKSFKNIRDAKAYIAKITPIFAELDFNAEYKIELK